ncbi:MAG: hypothetical protein ACLPSW_16690 [Roseiarcus sp.]
MISRQASLIVADDMYTNMTGKQTLQGIYTGDIHIPANPSVVPQLLFYFIIDTDVTDPFKSIVIEITLPGEPTMQIPVVLVPTPSLPDRTRQTFRVSALAQFPQLRPGRIQAKVIHEKGEIVVGAPWINLIKPAAPPVEAG